MADVLLKPDENPRWSCCRAALGREPRTLDFVLWMSGKWEAFAKERGVGSSSTDAFLALGDKAHAAFDAWLRSAVEAGRFGEVPRA